MSPLSTAQLTSNVFNLSDDEEECAKIANKYEHTEKLIDVDYIPTPPGQRDEVQGEILNTPVSHEHKTPTLAPFRQPMFDEKQEQKNK